MTKGSLICSFPNVKYRN